MNPTRKTGAHAHQATVPESYVVRIYRRHARLPGRLTGTVEIVANGSELSFTGLRELARILVNGQPGDPANSAQK